MMNVTNAHKRQTALETSETIQRRILRAIGIDPNVLAEKVAEETNYASQQRAKLQSEGHSDFETLGARFNEVAYGDAEHYQHCEDTVTPTNYSDLYLLQRLPNLVSLCRKFYARKFGENRDFFVSTVPLGRPNGITVKLDEQLDLILLCDGLMFIIPSLIKQLPEIGDHNYGTFELSQKVNFAEEFSSYRGKCERFFDMMVLALSDAAVTPDMHHGINTKKFDGHGGHETWKYSRLLTAKIRGEAVTAESLNQVLVESLSEMGQKQIDYYRTRGIFLFLVAHEISHVYRDHIGKRATTKGDLEYVAALLDDLDRLEVPHGCRDTFDALDRNAFAANFQPFEIEADADALEVLQAYWKANQISKDQFSCMIDGVVAGFFIFEFMRLIKAGVENGAQAAADLNNLEFAVRNFFVESEHPCPLSRLGMASYRAADGLDPEFVDMLEVSMNKHSQQFLPLWLWLAPRLDPLRQDFKLGKSLTFESEFIFSEFDAMGYVDRTS